MITVTLPYPVSANRYWRTRVVKNIAMTYVSSEAKAYKEQVGWLLRAAGVREPLQGRIAIAYTLYPNRPQDYRTRQRKLGDSWHDTVQCIDLDNAQKVLLDALKGIAFEDDAWVRRITAERAEPDGEARLVVKISQIATPQPQVGLDLAMPVADPLEV
jgi:crossover junction endodeoxyribonuclease RusA